MNLHNIYTQKVKRSINAILNISFKNQAQLYLLIGVVLLSKERSEQNEDVLNEQISFKEIYGGKNWPIFEENMSKSADVENKLWDQYQNNNEAICNHVTGKRYNNKTWDGGNRMELKDWEHQRD